MNLKHVEIIWQVSIICWTLKHSLILLLVFLTSPLWIRCKAVVDMNDPVLIKCQHQSLYLTSVLQLLFMQQLKIQRRTECLACKHLYNKPHDQLCPDLPPRRGSNVSLVLDMSALGSVEPLNVAVVTPREAAAREYLLFAGRPLTRQQLQDVVNNTHKLHTEFAVSTSIVEA